MINNHCSPIKDSEIEKYFNENQKIFKGTMNFDEIINNKPEFIIICVSTNFDEELNSFDTSNVENVIKKICDYKIKTTIVIKSTVPIGFTEQIKRKYNIDNIFFSPEFLREGKALYDNLYPSRIIVGETNKQGEKFANLLQNSALKKDIPIKYTSSTEAESIKLFANSYLAMRISFFNELDSFCENKKIDTKNVIEGICLDERIGNYYNNPSFGYGGYCLPKDTKQLLSDYKEIPNEIISSIVKSNEIRKQHVINSILSKNYNTIGIYRINFKKNSDNFRSSAILSIAEELKKYKKIIIYEPLLKNNYIKDIEIINDLNKFKQISNIIITNRFEKELIDVEEKVYTRDLFGNN